MRLAGLHSVVSAHGATSTEAAASAQLLASAVAAAVRSFHDAYGGAAAAQIVALAEVPLAPLPAAVAESRRRELIKARTHTERRS